MVVVSEERGTISFCFSGNIVSNLDGQSLRHALLGLFGRSSRRRRFAKKVAQVGRASLPTPAARAPAVGATQGAGPGHEPGKPAAAKPAPIEAKIRSAGLEDVLDDQGGAEPRRAADGADDRRPRRCARAPRRAPRWEPAPTCAPAPAPRRAARGDGRVAGRGSPVRARPAGHGRRPRGGRDGLSRPVTQRTFRPDRAGRGDRRIQGEREGIAPAR